MREEKNSACQLIAHLARCRDVTTFLSLSRLVNVRATHLFVDEFSDTDIADNVLMRGQRR